ncbi:TRAP transporter large permease [Thalassospira profundimaris]|uniref:TRAP transporter large permease protein n=1 Tax=Thalassospira profundimaris TaxID=502049 RepID=A0A367WJ22_9PROT|nr:TRAP transporter large permease [Thalassospira profundimaris]RCK41456.1 C4-dicarboxylate ABC transporter permease [Thalassospira profundimaris]
MSPVEISIIMVIVLMIFIFLRMPIALAMAIVGAGGYAVLSGWLPLSAYLKTAIVDKYVSYDLAVIPLFILMGQIATRTGISRAIFTASNAWLGHWKGGLAMASVAGCAAFGSICGSSIATATTMGKVALPEMRRHGYSGALGAGTLAAGGTLGILIPPSVVLIIYALLTEQNIVKLFLAATIPGILAVLGFILAIGVYVRLFPEEGPAHAGIPMRERIKSLGGIWHVALVFIAVLGGIYGGVFTPAEGASVGVVLIALTGFLMRSLTLKGLFDCVIETAGSTAMIFAIIFGADLFNVALALTRVPTMAAEWVGTAGIAPMTVLLTVILFYIVMGCIMDSLSMILLTVPVFFPAFMAMDFGMDPTHQAIWFGIISLIVVELGMITPPVGLNLFMISAMAPDIPTRKIFRGAVPFLIVECLRIAVIVAFPALTFWLVDIVTG